MTRARLDGVAVLVDADHWRASWPTATARATATATAMATATATTTEAAARAPPHRAAGDAFWRQVVCADVILLNQVDLLAAGAEGRCARCCLAAAPWARVPRTRGNVPLPLLLSLSTSILAARRASPATSRLLRARRLVPRGRRRSAEDVGAARAAEHGGGARMGGGWRARGFSSVEFTSDSPLRLAAFQDLMARQAARARAATFARAAAARAARQGSRLV